MLSLARGFSWVVYDAFILAILGSSRVASRTCFYEVYIDSKSKAHVNKRHVLFLFSFQSVHLLFAYCEQVRYNKVYQ